MEESNGYKKLGFRTDKCLLNVIISVFFNYSSWEWISKTRISDFKNVDQFLINYYDWSSIVSC